MKRKIFLMALAAATTGLAAIAQAETADKRIALSNNYAGNSWRQAMLQSWEKVTQKAVADGVVAAVDTFTTADQEVPTQAAQIQNLILQGYDAIVINAASPDALNGAVKAACDAGIVVVSFDGVVSEPCAWRVAVDYRALGQRQVEYLAERLPEGGNLLEIRGLAGTSIDNLLHEGISAGVKAHPKFKIAGEATGNWDQATAQRAVSTVLPSLPKIDAIVTQGGDGYGAAQAFRAAGRDIPIIIMGNRQDELAWWKEQQGANGYKTWSGTIAPGISTLAFWIAQQILEGKEVPKDVTVPYLSVTNESLEEALAGTPVGGVANKEYTQAEAIQAIKDNQ